MLICRQSFHVVVPSLPGYGYSEAPKVKGYGVKKMASIINRLMINLGYDKYCKENFRFALKRKERKETYG